MRGEIWKKLGIITVAAAFACSVVLGGCSDPNYFSRIFKKYEGKTPSEYRER